VAAKKKIYFFPDADREDIFSGKGPEYSVKEISQIEQAAVLADGARFVSFSPDPGQSRFSTSWCKWTKHKSKNGHFRWGLVGCEHLFWENHWLAEP